VFVDAAELGVGVGEGVFAVVTVAEHGVGFGGVQEAEAGEGVAAAGRRLGCGLGEREAG
jgi:hypothetical protein